MRYNKVSLLVFLFVLSSCAQVGVYRSRNLAFQEPTTFSEKLFYNITKPLAFTWVHPATSNTLLSLTGYEKLKNQGARFLRDLGGESIQIATEDGAIIDGMVFDPDEYQKRQRKAYTEWRAFLNEPRNYKLSQVFEVNFKGKNLQSFFEIPNLYTNKTKSKEKMGVVCLPACGSIYELDPKFILTFLTRGYHVLIINYRGIINSKGVPNWKGTCLDAKYACDWMTRHIGGSYSNIIICGKSFGTGPAVYAASKCPGSHVILDRAYARMSDVCDYSLPPVLKFLFAGMARNFVEKFYRFPNEDWIGHIKGKVLIVEATHDYYMKGQAQRLFDALAKSQLIRDDKELKELKKECWIEVSGGHYGKFWGDKTSSWYSDKKSQDLLSNFLSETTNVNK